MVFASSVSSPSKAHHVTVFYSIQLMGESMFMVFDEGPGLPGDKTPSQCENLTAICSNAQFPVVRS